MYIHSTKWYITQLASICTNYAEMMILPGFMTAREPEKTSPKTMIIVGGGASAYALVCRVWEGLRAHGTIWRICKGYEYFFFPRTLPELSKLPSIPK